MQASVFSALPFDPVLIMFIFSLFSTTFFPYFFCAIFSFLFIVSGSIFHFTSFSRFLLVHLFAFDLCFVLVYFCLPLPCLLCSFLYFLFNYLSVLPFFLPSINSLIYVSLFYFLSFYCTVVHSVLCSFLIHLFLSLV